MKLDNVPLLKVGSGDPVILLHGLFGNLSNWKFVADEFKATHTVFVPRLPLYSTPITQQRLDDLVDYLVQFVNAHALENVVLMGNSLGGHVALLYAYRHPEKVSNMVLAGSSGLVENSFAGTFPRVRDYAYIREKVQRTFYDAGIATKELVDEVYETIQSRSKTLSIIGRARAAQRHNVADILGEIYTPTLLIWGLQDTITPPEVALEFHDRLPQSQIVFFKQCGHVPMMEHPILFNQHVRRFLEH